MELGRYSLVLDFANKSVSYWFKSSCKVLLGTAIMSARLRE